MSTTGYAYADTYLQQTQGGRYVNNQAFIVNDIYQAGLTISINSY
ncbi:hypothetical protein [Nostoc sp. 'Lobaria pulmonaria (5183) cyanobiont']|nr:hypothetical protein [Nostoc sp. 'Lobaria pulmonaria (5183) cyanobiont']